VGKSNVSGEAGERTAWDDVYTGVDTAENMLRTVSSHLPLLLPLMDCTRALEVGPGRGLLSGFLAKMGVDVTAIELSPSVLDVARRFYHRIDAKVETVEGDGMATPFENHSFDAVFSQGLWEHFDDEHIRRFAVEALRLAPVVYASVPSMWYPRLGRHGPGVVGNERFMSPGRWQQILQPVDANVSAGYYPEWKILTVAGMSVPYPMQVLIRLDPH
jgi:SAM-dependent methyltransferase